MTGSTIDHLVSVTALVAALLVCMAIYSQTLSDAIAYQRNHQVAVKANDIVDSICLSTGLPEGWGQTNSTPTSFGLQSPETGGYSLSPFALQRLLASGGPFYYDRAETWFSNVSLGEGGYLLVPVAECVDCATAARLLGINGSYGFQLSIAPTLTVSITEVDANPLRLKVEVRGPGLALSDATVNYCLFRAYKGNVSEYPLIDLRSGIGQTDSKGSALLDFPGIDSDRSAYSVIVYAHLSGLDGIGYHSHEIMESAKGLIPFVVSYEEGKVWLAHSWDVHNFTGPQHALFYNATFLILTENYELRPIQIANSTGKVVYGKGHPYNQTQIPTSEPGILLVTYRTGNKFGQVMMPWGIHSLGVSITFGGDPSGRDWVATELRQVTVRKISYQVRLAVWREGG